MIFLLYLLIFILIFGLAFLIEAGMVWILCWALRAIGITTIFGWEVAFSWPLVLVVMIISSIFGGTRYVKEK